MAQESGALGISSSVDLAKGDLRARFSKTGDNDIELTRRDQDGGGANGAWASNGHGTALPEISELQDVPLASPFTTGFAPQTGAAQKRGPPLKHHWNWFAILIFLFYVGASGFYFYVRIMYSMINGPSFVNKFYCWFTLAVEMVGVTAMLPYALLMTRAILPTGSSGLPTAEEAEPNEYYDFHVRVLVPCYNEPISIVKDTLMHALNAKLPVGVRRDVYLCDDGNSPDKRELVERELKSKGCHYVTGRKRKEGELNGKSCNVNNCLQNYIYGSYIEKGEAIPQNEVVVIFDADMCAKPQFFTKILEVLVDPSIALCLTPQAFHNIPDSSDLFNNINLQFWEYWLPGATAWGYIACTGTNFAIRAAALQKVKWFPEYTITEDYALGFELKANGFKGTYLLQYLAMGEAPDEIRNVFRQRSRWTKGHWQVFLSRRCPLLHRKLPLMQKMWYSYGTWSYMATIILTPFFILIPFLSLAVGLYPLSINTWVAIGITAYYASIVLLQSYCRNLKHLQSLWWCQISNTVLWFTYAKAVINTMFAQIGLKQTMFKATPKKVGDTGAPPPSDKQTMLSPGQERSDMAGCGLSKTDSMMERGADGGRGNSRTVGYRDGNINVHVHIPEMRAMTKLPSGRMSYKSDDKRSGLKRVFKVFSPKNVGDLGGVLDPTALVILLMICLASVGMALYNVIVALVDGYNFADIKLAAFYLGMPLSWSLSAAVAPYLFVHYCFSAGKSFTRAAATLRFFQNILAVAALAFLWLGLPPEVDYTPALSTSARFMTQQVSYAKEIPDAALLSANSAVDFKGAPGYFPTGADPVKYAPAIAYTTTMLSWSLTQFGQGFEYTSSVKDAVEMVTAGADYLVASTQVKGAEATSFIARVGDPALYIDRGVGEVDPPIDRIWATPEAELKREMEKTKGRAAVVVDAKNLGVDALGSSAAALAAAAIVARTYGLDKEKIYLDTAKALYALAETQLKAAPPAKDKALAAPILSYCGAVDLKTGVNKCSFTVKAIETVPVRPATAPSIEGYTCWVPHTQNNTCVPGETEVACRDLKEKTGKMFRSPFTCCNELHTMMNANLSETDKKPKPAGGVCTLWTLQGHKPEDCYYVSRLDRDCKKDIMGWRGTKAGERTWEGCSGGTNFVVRASLDQCCAEALLELGATSRKELNGTCKGDPVEDPAVVPKQDPEKPLNPGDKAANGAGEAKPLPGAAAVEEKPAKPVVPEKPAGGGKPAAEANAGRRLQQKADSPTLTVNALQFDDPGWTDPWTVEPKRVEIPVTVTERRFDSNSSYDDMAWAGAWLFKATGQKAYLGKAQSHLQRHEQVEAQSLKLSSSYYMPNWANINWHTQVLLAQESVDKTAHSKARDLFNVWVFRRNPLEQNEIDQLKQASAVQREDLKRKTTGEVAEINGEKVVVMECVPQKVGKKEGEKDDGLPLKYKEFEDLCTDGEDDDCDGLIDSDDPDCGMEPVKETSPQQGFAWTADEAAPNAASAAFLALVYSQNNMKGLSEQEALDVPTQVKLRCWAMGQANFLLGVNKQRQSFIVDYARGHAKQAPTQPKHQASSCPLADQPCDWNSGYKLRSPNPQMDLVRGALISGVGFDESYPEQRESPSARVGTHYQAPWLGLLAGLVQTNTNVMSCGQQGVYQKVFDDNRLPPVASSQ